MSRKSLKPLTPTLTVPAAVDSNEMVSSPPPECGVYFSAEPGMPTDLASCPATRWSTPPADPPPIGIAPGSFFHSVRKSSRVLNGDPAGTATTWKSSASRAIGVVSARENSAPRAMPPSITVPVTIRMFG